MSIGDTKGRSSEGRLHRNERGSGGQRGALSYTGIHDNYRHRLVLNRGIVPEVAKLRAVWG
jgi:hypothetical protein